MPLIPITAGEFRVSHDVEAVLTADSLGSSIAVSLYDPVAQVGGLAHLNFLATPVSQPAEGGIPQLLTEARRQGAENGRLVVTISGGAQLLQDAAAGNIGKRNYLSVRKTLWKLGVMLQGEAVGGTVTRSVRLEVATGKFWLCEPGQPEQELIPAS